MTNMTNAIVNTVPISMFNRGLAGQVFEEVKKTGAKVVMKNNTAECVLLSPEEYVRLMDEINDARLLTLAEERWEKFDRSTAISEEEMYRRVGIRKEDLDKLDEVELE